MLGIYQARQKWIGKNNCLIRKERSKPVDGGVGVLVGEEIKEKRMGDKRHQTHDIGNSNRRHEKSETFVQEALHKVGKWHSVALYSFEFCML